ncbi:hypothetical protein VTK56DRAFT_5905 [Thermocarpiscus australiensis]
MALENHDIELKDAGEVHIILNELSRSIQRVPSDHALWKNCTTALSRISDWQGKHEHWRAACEMTAMPYLPKRSSLVALRYLDTTTPSLPLKLENKFKEVHLCCYLFEEEPSLLWKSAELDDDGWRAKYMKASAPARGTMVSVDRLVELIKIVFREKPKEVRIYHLKSEVSSQESDERASTERRDGTLSQQPERRNEELLSQLTTNDSHWQQDDINLLRSIDPDRLRAILSQKKPTEAGSEPSRWCPVSVARKGEALDAAIDDARRMLREAQAEKVAKKKGETRKETSHKANDSDRGTSKKPSRTRKLKNRREFPIHPKLRNPRPCQLSHLSQIGLKRLELGNHQPA